jgi:hypothetical protein
MYVVKAIDAVAAVHGNMNREHMAVTCAIVCPTSSDNGAQDLFCLKVVDATTDPF